ncbi:MAG: hypothetical protein GF350_07285, partial [Chitinivibrionales bacterium]|nr:hypothetical protein [Chitinivibrionales bacterium]
MKRFNNGTGLTGTYFSDANFQNEVKTKVDSIMAFSWYKQNPTGSDLFSVRWEGYLVPIRTERHRFSCWIPKNWKVKVWINDTIRLHDESYTQFGFCHFGDTLTEPLEAYTYVPIKVELASGGTTGYFSLEWYSLTAIPTMPIMPTQLYPKDHDTTTAPEGYQGGPAVAAASRHRGPPAEFAPEIHFLDNRIHIAIGNSGAHSVKVLSLTGAT